MSQSVKLSDGSYIDASAVWDSNKSKTQQQFNIDISNDVATAQTTADAAQTAANNAQNTANDAQANKVHRNTTYYSDVYIGNDVPSDRHFELILSVASSGRTGVNANYSQLHLIATKSGLQLTALNPSTNVWNTIWSLTP